MLSYSANQPAKSSTARRAMTVAMSAPLWSRACLSARSSRHAIGGDAVRRRTSVEGRPPPVRHPSYGLGQWHRSIDRVRLLTRAICPCFYEEVTTQAQIYDLSIDRTPELESPL